MYILLTLPLAILGLFLGIILMFHINIFSLLNWVNLVIRNVRELLHGKSLRWFFSIQQWCLHTKTYERNGRSWCKRCHAVIVESTFYVTGSRKRVIPKLYKTDCPHVFPDFIFRKGKMHCKYCKKVVGTYTEVKE